MSERTISEAFEPEIRAEAGEVSPAARGMSMTAPKREESPFLVRRALHLDGFFVVVPPKAFVEYSREDALRLVRDVLLAIRPSPAEVFEYAVLPSTAESYETFYSGLPHPSETCDCPHRYARGKCPDCDAPEKGRTDALAPSFSSPNAAEVGRAFVRRLPPPNA
jgi:hypothetical protein